MKRITSSYKSDISQKRQSISSITESEYRSFLKVYGPTKWLELDFAPTKSKPMRISGYGWIVKNEGFAKPGIYFRELTSNIEIV